MKTIGRILVWGSTAAMIGVLFAAERESEADHVRRLQGKYGGAAEAVLWDRTRVDLLTESEAIEVDFARKWAEAIGQSLYYSIVTGKKPAIVLLFAKGEDRYVFRCQTVCAKHGIRLYVEPTGR